MVNIVNWLNNPPSLRDKIYREAGFHPDHGTAIQKVVDQLERIVVSRCASTAGIQLLDEGYASKGFGIKAKSCDWGPFHSFVLAHVQFAKFAGGATPAANAKQQSEFDKAKKQTGFAPSDYGNQNSLTNSNRHSSMADEEILLVSEERLYYLRSIHQIFFTVVRDKELIFCQSPWGGIYFRLKDCNPGLGSRGARWAILHHTSAVNGVQSTGWNYVRGMKNMSPGGRAVNINRQCCAGDYDLWGIFPKMNSSVKSTASLAKHGMDRQMTLVATLMPGASLGIRNRVNALRQHVHDKTQERTHHLYGKYQEDREKGNVSPLTMHTARALNRAIRAAGYQGGDMFHHNDDMGNPFRSDIEQELIAFVPGEQNPYFLQSSADGLSAGISTKGLGPILSWNDFVKKYESTYHFYDNASIHRHRRNF